MRKNKIKQMMKDGKPVINGWLSIPSTVSAEAMAHQGWDSLTIDLQHGLVDYTNALPMLQTISSTNVTPLTRVNWNEPGQIMKLLDAGSYGLICPMVSNKKQAENFVQASMYPPNGYRSFGPIRGMLYGGNDYAKNADSEMLKILTDPRNALIKQYEKLFQMEDFEIEFDQGAMKKIVQLAQKRNSGARALRSVLEEILMDLMYEVPDMEKPGKITISESFISGNSRPRISKIIKKRTA